MRIVPLTVVMLALTFLGGSSALARSGPEDAGGTAGQLKQRAEKPATSSRVRKPRRSPSGLDDMATTLPGLPTPPSVDGSYRVYVPGRSPLYCFGVGGVVTCD